MLRRHVYTGANTLWQQTFEKLPCREVCLDEEDIVSSTQGLSGPADAETAQTYPHSDEYKEDLKREASRTDEYGERVLEESDAVIAENGCGVTGSASQQVTEVREV